MKSTSIFIRFFKIIPRATEYLKAEKEKIKRFLRVSNPGITINDSIKQIHPLCPESGLEIDSYGNPIQV